MTTIESSFPAFKEWQLVCSALASGQQSLILRKGGIAEGRRGFEWKYPAFFLFPTRFHQQADGVKGALQPDADRGDNSVEISLYAEVEWQGKVTDWERIDALAEHHVWTEEVVRERFQWGDEPGLSVAVLRVYRLAKPWLLQNADRPEFGGCRSWLRLPVDEMPVASPSLRAGKGEPAIDDSAFARQLQKLRELVGDLD